MTMNAQEESGIPAPIQEAIQKAGMRVLIHGTAEDAEDFAQRVLLVRMVYTK